MSDLPQGLFANPVWHALHTAHRRFALSCGKACRYPGDVAPFAALETSDRSAMRDLHSLLAPGESVWLVGDDLPSSARLSFDGILECVQMVLPAGVTPPDPNEAVVPLSSENAVEMVALTDVAFPGFFRRGTCEMGDYYGVRSGGELIAMCGERLMLDGYAKISGLCTHPSHRGQGFAVGLIGQLIESHRRRSIVSWLHVGAANHRAIEIYRRLGFRNVRTVTLQRVSRPD